jgi:CheY-like chemotaxis protein
MDADSGAEERKLTIPKAIEAVLDRHGVPERQRLTTLEAAAEMSYQQVRRRMTGETPWNVDEIKRLASHFGEPLFQLLGTLVDDVGQQATLLLGGISLPCSIWTGPLAPPKARIGPLVAIAGDSGDHWTVVPLLDAGTREAYEVKRLIFESAPARRVAIVDDDDDLAASILQFLREKGLDAISYRTGEHLRAAMETSRFDGFILDWMLGDANIRELLAQVRARHPNAPVVVLTGEVEAGSAQEDELAATISAYRAQLYEKPTRMLSLFNALELGFGPSPPSG